jgi:hypothetical protein
VWLEIRRGRARNLVRHVTSAVYLIGSARDCDLVLGDAQFPQAFAYLFVNPSGVTIRRLGTGPVLTVNGQAIEATRVEDGDRIRTGPFEFCVRIDEPTVPATATEGRQLQPQHWGVGQQRRQYAQRRVQHLLADIRHAVFPPRVGLRLYVGPEQPSHTTDSPHLRVHGSAMT